MDEHAQLRSLTSLRFFAALLVLGSHMRPLSDSHSTLARHTYEIFLSEGYVGVTFFFILSGFILSHSYADRLLNSMVSPRQFWVARIARVYPLHAMTMVMSLPLSVLAGIGVAKISVQLLAQATLTQSFMPAEWVYSSLNFPAWSLSVEAFFYALFPLLVRLSTIRLIAVVALGCVYHSIVAVCAWNVHFLAYTFPPARLIDFVVGILAYRTYVRCNEASQARATILQLAALSSLGLMYFGARSASQALRYDLLYVLPMAAVILSCAWQHGLVARVLARPGLVFLGDASFALYLIHQIIIRVGEIGRSHLRSPSDLTATVVYVLLSVAASIAIYRSMEIPAKRIIIKLLTQSERSEMVPESLASRESVES
jgi:peptidoglycan/LPS O-acetylase OafA/YrhL